MDEENKPIESQGATNNSETPHYSDLYNQIYKKQKDLSDFYYRSFNRNTGKVLSPSSLREEMSKSVGWWYTPSDGNFTGDGRQYDYNREFKDGSPIEFESSSHPNMWKSFADKGYNMPASGRIVFKKGGARVYDSDGNLVGVETYGRDGKLAYLSGEEGESLIKERVAEAKKRRELEKAQKQQVEVQPTSNVENNNAEPQVSQQGTLGVQQEPVKKEKSMNDSESLDVNALDKALEESGRLNDRTK